MKARRVTGMLLVSALAVKNLQLSMRFQGLKSMTTMRFSRLSQKKPV